MTQTNTTVWLRDAFPHRVELSRILSDQADVWLQVNLPDTGDAGDQSGWLWDRSSITTKLTHIYSFRSSEHAAQFALTFS